VPGGQHRLADSYQAPSRAITASDQTRRPARQNGPDHPNGM